MQGTARAFSGRLALAGTMMTACCAVCAAQGDDSLRAHSAELWGAWMAMVVLIFVLSGARHALKPVGRPMVPIILRGVVAICYSLPMIGVLYGKWVFARGIGVEPMHAFDAARVATLRHIALGTLFLAASPFCRFTILGTAFFSAIGWVNQAQFVLALNLPGREVWGQGLGHIGFLLSIVCCVLILVTSPAQQRLETSRDVLLSRLRPHRVGLALTLSLVPGLGWLYATGGRRGHGWFVLFLSIALAAYVVFVPLWRKVLFPGSPYAGAGPLLFALCYAATAGASAWLAYAAARRTRRLS